MRKNDVRQFVDRPRRRRMFRAFTLIELAVVMAIILIVATLALPALGTLLTGPSIASTKNVVQGIFAAAQARAAVSQNYVGVRFQQASDGRSYAVMLRPARAGEPGFDNGCPDYTDTDGDQLGDCNFLTFVADEDMEPNTLPEGMELAGLNVSSAAAPDNELSTNIEDATTFTVVFSSEGRIIRKQVHVSQRQDNGAIKDSVFNLTANTSGGYGLLLPDVEDTAPLASLTDTDPDSNLNPANNDIANSELSERGFLVYERQKRVNAGATPYTGYVQQQALRIDLNVYTGAMIRQPK